MRIFSRCGAHSGFSSSTKAMKVWTPLRRRIMDVEIIVSYLQIEESARLTIMKKKRKDQSCGMSISSVASGIAINANPVDC